MTLEQITIQCSTMKEGETQTVDFDQTLQPGELLKLARDILDKMPTGLGVILKHVGNTIDVICFSISY